MVAVQGSSADTTDRYAIADTTADGSSAQKRSSDASVSSAISSAPFSHAPTAAFAPVFHQRDPAALSAARDGPHASSRVAFGFGQLNADSLAAAPSVWPHSRVRGAANLALENARLQGAARAHDHAIHSMQLGLHLPSCVSRPGGNDLVPGPTVMMPSMPQPVLTPYGWCHVPAPGATVLSQALSGACLPSAVTASMSDLLLPGRLLLPGQGIADIPLPRKSSSRKGRS